MRVRLAAPPDAEAIARIYNQGIEERTATFETELRSERDILAWFDDWHPTVVVEEDSGAVVAFARSSEYRPRECYRGVFEFAVYTDRAARRRGAGALAMREIVTQARAAGAWKLLSRIFVDNTSSRALMGTLGFREVGVYHRHAKLDGVWRDVVIVEKFLAPVGAEGSIRPVPVRAPRDQVLFVLRSEKGEGTTAALEAARAFVQFYRRLDLEILDAACDAFFSAKVHDAAARARYVELFRAYASLSPEAARSLYGALFLRLERWSVAFDLDAFYEATFVVKQVAFATSDAAGAAALAPHRLRLLDWMRQAIDLPAQSRGRISAGNLTSVLMTLAVAASASEEERSDVIGLAADAKARHRVEPPPSMRPPPAPTEAGPIVEVIPPVEVSPKKKAAKKKRASTARGTGKKPKRSPS